MPIPKKDSELAPYAANFGTVLSGAPATYNVSAATATAVGAAVDAYVAAYTALAEARANGVRSASQTAAKDALRKTMLEAIRPVYQAVSWSTISDQAKVLLGVHIRPTHNSTQPVYGFPPQLVVEKVDGSVVTARVRDSQEPNRKGFPPGVDGVTVCSFTGPVAPLDPAAYAFAGSSGKSTINVALDPTLAPGTKVWLVCFFFNHRKESSPACMPVDVTINYASSIPMAS